MNPPDLKYSKEHEWLRVEADGTGVIGITEFASESLGDVVFVELPEADGQINQFEKMGEIESVKAVSDLFSPISGHVLARNEELLDKPELVNDGPYDSGWLVKVKLEDTGELDSLLTVTQYESFLASQER